MTGQDKYPCHLFGWWVHPAGIMGSRGRDKYGPYAGGYSQRKALNSTHVRLLNGKEFPLVFTVQKLRMNLEALSQMTEGPAQLLSPVYSVAAAGPMAIPSLTDTQWQPVGVGQLWGLKHGTSWLMTPLQVPASIQGLPLVL